MNGLWTFSTSNQALLRRVIDNAPPAEENNEWAKYLNITHYGNIFLKEPNDISSGDHENIFQNIPVDDTENLTAITSPTFGENEKNLCEIIENDLVANFTLIVDECMKNPSLFNIIANNATTASIEKFCHHICATDADEKFVISYLEIFLPAILMKQLSCGLDILFGASKTYPQLFRMHFLPVILNNTTISNNVLYGFVQNLDSKEKKMLLDALCGVQLKFDEFSHHILSIYTLYKDSDATSYVNSYIYTNIRQFSDNCVNDKNFGRLLLAFIQSVYVKDVDRAELENIIENHRSAFRKPCLSKLDSKFKSQ